MDSVEQDRERGEHQINWPLDADGDTPKRVVADCAYRELDAIERSSEG
jgi:hypothetical protein